MSCGCSKPSYENASVTEDQPSLSHVFLAPNETIECFAGRAEAPPEPDAPPPIDEIATASITADCKMYINTKLVMTPGSHQVTWDISFKDDKEEPVTITELGLTFQPNTGVLQGKVNDKFAKKTITATVKAIAAEVIPAKPAEGSNEAEPSVPVSAELQTRTYKFAAEKCNPANSLKFVHPSPTSKVGDLFGMRVHPIHHTRKMHKGVDLKTHGKADVLAAADGVVRIAKQGCTGPGCGYGNVVYIDHKNSNGKIFAQTRYGHLSKIYVKEKQQVAAGTPIGHEGATGGVTGPHLHFEIWINGVAVDPLPYITGKIQVDIAGVTPSTIDNKDVAITESDAKAKTDCKATVYHEKDPTYKLQPGGKSSGKQIFFPSLCRPDGPKGKPSKEEVINRVSAVLDKHPELLAEDRKFFMEALKIECRYDPYASARPAGTSALGPFQMVDATAKQHYKKIGVEPTCENRCNIEFATEAEIDKYKGESAIYDKYKATGKILGRFPPNNEHTAIYVNLPKSAFMYLVHHDGIGSVQRGKDAQGVAAMKTHSDLL